MDTQHPFPTCKSTNEPIGEGQEMTLGSNKVQKIQTGVCSIFTFHNMANIRDHHFHSLVEISLSPAKYSIFQILGFKVFELAGLSYLSLRSTAVVGAVGGTVLSFLYFVLLFRRRHLAYDELNITSTSSYVQVLCKETAYSGLAGVIGALAIGQCSTHELSYFAIAGILGPILFLILMFSMVGLVIGVVWSAAKLKNHWDRVHL